MSPRVDPRHRDGLLATIVLAGLLAGGRLLGYRPRRVLRPAGLLAGAIGAITIEGLLAIYPDRARELWSRRELRSGGSIATLGGGLVLAVAFGPIVLSLLVGGLLGYLLLLAGVLVGVVPEPETWFECE